MDCDKLVIDIFISKNKRKKVVAIQGLGFVGSVMALVCANAVSGDYVVIGFDLAIPSSQEKIAALNQSKFPLKTDDPLVKKYYNQALKNGNFLATCCNYAYQVADIVVVDVAA
jgi:UDP-N-acetyl-D-mannosaminuronate dehydrogenase